MSRPQRAWMAWCASKGWAPRPRLPHTHPAFSTTPPAATGNDLGTVRTLINSSPTNRHGNRKPVTDFAAVVRADFSDYGGHNARFVGQASRLSFRGRRDACPTSLRPAAWRP